MGFGLVLAGLAFFLIPSVGMIDLMPDFIGCALIMIGLSKTAELNGDLADARIRFRYLFYLTLFHAAMILPLARIGDETTTMLFVFSFAIAEAVFFILGATSLLEGTYYLSSRGGCDITDKKYNDLKVVFPLFAIARGVLVALPELTVLTNTAYKDTLDVEDLYKPTLYEARNVIILLCFGVSLMIGIVFYAAAARFFSVPAKSAELRESLSEKYSLELTEDPLRFVCKSTRTAVYLIAAGSAFLSTLYFYGFDVLLDTIGFAFLCAGSAVLAKYAPQAKKALYISISAAVISVLSGAQSVYVADHYFHKSYLLTENAVRAYTVLAILQTAQYILFAAILVCLYRSVCAIVKKYVRAPVLDEADYADRFCVKFKILFCVGAGLCPVMSLFGFLYMYNEQIWIVGLFVFTAYTVYLLKTLTALPYEIERSM